MTTAEVLAQPTGTVIFSVRDGVISPRKAVHSKEAPAPHHRRYAWWNTRKGAWQEFGSFPAGKTVVASLEEAKLLAWSQIAEIEEHARQKRIRAANFVSPI